MALILSYRTKTVSLEEEGGSGGPRVLWLLQKLSLESQRPFQASTAHPLVSARDASGTHTEKRELHGHTDKPPFPLNLRH